MISTSTTYQPDIAIHPGETLEENLKALSMSQSELSDRTGLALKTVNEIVKGKNAITPQTAIKLERAMGISSSFWNNLQKQYDETLARLEAENSLADEIEHTKKFTCYSELARYGLVERTNNWHVRTQSLLRFFGIDSFAYLMQVQSAAFRRKQRDSISPENLAAWLRWGEIQADALETREFDKSSVQQLIPNFRTLTRSKDEKVWRRLQGTCANMGIAVVFVPTLKCTGVNGATRWKGDKAILQLSDRYKRDDAVWFTFFHELCHILRHGKKQQFVEWKNDGDVSQEEQEADAFARDTLIPPKEYAEFAGQGDFSAHAITRFANAIGISESVVSGRLAKEGCISWQIAQSYTSKIAIRTS